MELPVSGLWFVVPTLAGAAMAQAAGAHKASHVGADVFGGYTYVSPDFGLYNQSSGQSGCGSGYPFHAHAGGDGGGGFFPHHLQPGGKLALDDPSGRPAAPYPAGPGDTVCGHPGRSGNVHMESEWQFVALYKQHIGRGGCRLGLDVRLTRHV